MRIRYLGCCVGLAGLAIAGPGTASGRPVHTSCVHAVAAVPARATGDRLLAVGVPDGRVGSIAKAGYVVVTYGADPENRRLIRQASPGIPGDPAPRGGFGSSVASGDFDHDGHPDLAIGASRGRTGSVTLVFGSASGPSGGAVALTASAYPRCPSYGRGLAAGDFNGDGYTDAAFGTAQDLGGRSAGSVTVLYGGRSGLSGTGAQRIRQGENGAPGRAERKDGMGRFLALADLNGDGHADLAASAPSENHGSGAVLVFPGTSSGVATEGATMMCGAPHTGFGSVLAARP